MIEDGYHSTNPYHNAVHATDVCQAMHCFLQQTKVNHSFLIHINPSKNNLPIKIPYQQLSRKHSLVLQYRQTSICGNYSS